MGTYTASRATATKLIDRFGRSVSFVKDDRTPADSNAPWDGPDTTSVSITVKAAIVEYELEEVDETRVKFGDKKALVSASAVEAANSSADLGTFDKMIDGSVTWSVVKVNIVDPGDERVLYEIQVRK